MKSHCYLPSIEQSKQVSLSSGRISHGVARSGITASLATDHLAPVHICFSIGSDAYYGCFNTSANLAPLLTNAQVPASRSSSENDSVISSPGRVPYHPLIWKA
ncbi:hypothetical protein RJT34_04835 [Clitoria ternatea]|uniref:Uncharacterized protein n=1 Tax=Clitoria ternatea TaxID=43366 RepID=A0AAN9KNE4_CLITE